jgi:hypothetical protein
MALPNINQFTISTVQGQLDMLAPGSVLTGQVDAAQATALVPGQAVAMATTAGGLPKFVALTSNSQKAFGFVVRNLKDINDPAYANFELAISEAIMWMTSNAAITRGANVEVVISNNTVITSAGVNPIVGIALDTATGSAQLIRVLIKVPSTGANTSLAQIESATVTQAQINSSTLLIPGIPGKSITVSNFAERVGSSSFLTGTAVVLESSNSSVLVATLAQAQLTASALLYPGASGVTLGAGFATALPAGEGLSIAGTGSAFTNGSTLQSVITFQQV